jgi:hypothetical protein
MTHPADDANARLWYWAFISYSQHDAKWAQWLHGELEKYKIPRALVGRKLGGQTIPQRLIPIFRDREELPSAGDLGEKIREALEASHALVVVCSPHAARSPWVNEEVRAFKALGRSHRVFPLIVDGEPYASGRYSGPEECFPPALRFAVAADGVVTSQRADPLAADVRDGKDGRSNARLKLIAGILGVGFDHLRRRELARQRRKNLMASLSLIGAGLLSGFTYVAVADADIDVPGALGIRRVLDRQGYSFFRPVASYEGIVRQGLELRKKLRSRLVDLITQGKVRLSSDYTSSIWELGQVAAAIYQDAGSTDADIQLFPPLLAQAFRDDFVLKSEGSPIGWRGDGPLSRVETALWMIMAITAALKRADAEVEPIRTLYGRYLATVQGMAEHYYRADDGGWNTLIEDRIDDHSIYSSALALNALIELRSAKLCWGGNCERLQKLIEDTSTWLIRTFVEESGVAGWRRSLAIDDVIDPDMSLLVYGALGRSNVPLPNKIRAAALQRLTDLRHQPYHPAHHDLTHWTVVAGERGQPQTVIMPTRVFWYPWAISALVHWLQYIESNNYPPETRRALLRSLGHLAISESAEMLDDMSRVGLYVVAETCYGMGSVR